MKKKHINLLKNIVAVSLSIVATFGIVIGVYNYQNGRENIKGSSPKNIQNSTEEKESNDMTYYVETIYPLGFFCCDSEVFEASDRYSFKYEKSRYLIKDNKNSNVIETDNMRMGVATDGKVLYYTTGMKIMKMNLDTNEKELIYEYKYKKKDKSPLREALYMYSQDEDDENILKFVAFEEGGDEMICIDYNVKTGKVKMNRKDDIIVLSRNHFLLSDDTVDKYNRSRYFAYTLSDYDFSLKKCSQTRVVRYDDSSGAEYLKATDKKIYFAAYDEYNNKTALYRTDLDGNNHELLIKIKDLGNKFDKITDDYCIYNDKKYEYETK